MLALDHGLARCGCAISDPTRTLATPVDPVPRPESRKGMRRLVGLVAEHEVARVVVGLPLSLSGGETDQTRQAREFAARLSGRLGPRIPVELYDERLTTAQARRDPAGTASEDSRAAAHLLEGWLAAQAGRGDSGVAGRGDPGGGRRS